MGTNLKPRDLHALTSRTTATKFGINNDPTQQTSHSWCQSCILRGGQGATPPCENSGSPLCLPPPNETGCKVAGLQNSCIHSMASHRWCQITPFTQSCIMSSEILAPPPNEDVTTPLATPPPQTAAARNAPATQRGQTVNLGGRCRLLSSDQRNMKCITKGQRFEVEFGVMGTNTGRERGGERVR